MDHAKALIARFGSIAAISAASEREVQSVPGVGPARARAVLNALQPTPPAKRTTTPIERPI
jgi:excinuclease UvrABC nuclease subunit